MRLFASKMTRKNNKQQSGRNNRKNKPQQRGQNRKNKESPMTMMNRSVNPVAAQRFLTTLTVDFVGQILSNSNSLTAGAFAISANNLYHPFILSSYATGCNKIDNLGTSAITALFSSAASTTQLNGQNALNNLYSTYRINNSKLEIIVNQQSAIDTQLWSVACVTQQEYLANVYPLGPNSFSGLQGFKQLMTSNGGGTQRMVSSVVIHKVLGYTKLQYDTVLPTSWTNTNTTQTDDCIWVVQWNSLSNAFTAGEIFITVRLTAQIECSGPLNAQG